MREALFIKKNKDRWQQMQTQPGSEPDEMANEFVQLVEDLGYSKTFYPKSKVTSYLNTEASKRYLGIYENQKLSTEKIKWFFKYGLPLVMGKHLRLFLICTCLFVLFIIIGFFSAKMDASFVRQILGNEYVDMTEEHILKGQPFKVYGYGNEFLSFMGLFLHNAQVSLQLYAGGILLGIPTIKGLLYNGIMVGAFEYMFYSKGMLQASLLTIFIHGTIELSTIVIAATAGLVLAKSWIFPGTKTRMAALKEGAKESLIIALSSVPMLMIAAFFEGFVTRHTDMPLVLKLLIIIASLALVVGYFVLYPMKLKRTITDGKNG